MCSDVLFCREEMHRDQLIDKDLVIAVGGDGTVLNSASFLGDKIPLLGGWVGGLHTDTALQQPQRLSWSSHLISPHPSLACLPAFFSFLACALIPICVYTYVCIPICVHPTGVNSDPTRDDEASVTKVVDERRSKGALCASSAVDLHTTLPIYLSGCIAPQVRTRIRCVVKRWVV
jgi:hypothetical protein